MSERARKITELPVLVSASADDLLVVVDDPAGAANTKSITVSRLLTNSIRLSASRIDSRTAPATATSTGTEGDIIYDGSYLYVCIAANTWRRTSLTAW